MKKSGPWAAPVACAAALVPFTSPAADDAALAELRAEISELKAEYAGRVAALEARIGQLEATATAATPPPGAAAGMADAQPDAPSTTEPAAQAEPGAAALPPAPGGLRSSAYNPAIGVILTGTYANLDQDPESYAIAGFMPSGGEIGPGERSFSLGESEITFSASVDPYFTGSLTAAFAGDGELEVEEAFFRTTALPYGLSVKGGRFFSGVGYLNEIHAHAWDFIDQPLAYQALFGGQYAQEGVQVKWVAPTDLFIELGAETGNGSNFPGTRVADNGLDGLALFAHFGGDFGASIGWRAGVSWLDLDAVERTYEDVDSLGNAVINAFSGSSRTWIADATLKWSPGGDARSRAFKLQAEYMQREEDGALAFDIAGAALEDGFRSRQDAWYVQGVYQFMPRWRAGLRYDDLDAGSTRIGLVGSGALTPADFPSLAPASPGRVSLMLDWSPSEFSRLRAQYAWDDARDADTDEQWLLQYIHAIGAHGAHKF
jgi:hypothetical protein